MSVHNTEKLQCPQCQHEQAMTFWSALNTLYDADQKDLLFKGQLNRFTCSACGFDTPVDIPFLYHDVARRFAIQFYPPQNIDKSDFLQNFNRQGLIHFESDIGVEIPDYFRHIQVVFDMNELLRYVLFREYLYEHQAKLSDVPSVEPEAGHE